MKIRVKAIMAAIPLSLTALPMGNTLAFANSAPEYWSGTSASGVVLTGSCPVVVEKEVLSFHIPSFPQSDYASAEDFALYRAGVTAEYSFYNPTDSDLEMTLLFPVGSIPEYVDETHENEERYAVLADGERVETTLRHTFSPRSRDGRFDVNESMGRVREGCDESIYSRDLPVTYCGYSLQLPAGADEDKTYLLRFNFDLNPEKTLIVAPDARSYGTENGRTFLTFRMGKNRVDYGYWTVGAVVRPDVCVTDYDSEVPLEGYTVQENRADEGSFGEFVAKKAPDGVSETDWYNATVDSLRYSKNPSGVARDFSILSRELLRWYEYSLAVPAGGRVVNAVSAPLYPEINGTTCRYEYYLSPAQKWSEFRKIEIGIETPYKLSNSSLVFAEREGGYFFERDSLPVGELTFTLTNGTTVGTTETERVPFGYGLDPTFVKVIISLVVVIVAAIVSIVVVVLSLGKNSRKTNNKK